MSRHSHHPVDSISYMKHDVMKKRQKALEPIHYAKPCLLHTAEPGSLQWSCIDLRRTRRQHLGTELLWWDLSTEAVKARAQLFV